MISLYGHIPFCLSKCPYCDFFSLGMGEAVLPEEDLVHAMRAELDRWTGWLASPPEVGSLFLGGGTPSLLAAHTVAQILEHCRKIFSWGPNMERTLEMNPKTADPEKLAAFRAAGINRISMGLQSLDDKILRLLGRAHSSQEALQSLHWVLQAGFDSCNIDLMYGLPEQSQQDLEATLASLSAYDLPHLSAYELIIEEGTPFKDLYRYEEAPLPSTEALLQMRSTIESFAQSQGMERYEISNYARPGHQCRHNLNYWNYESFIGIGPSAISFLKIDELAEAFFQDFPLPDQEDKPYGVRLIQPKTSHPKDLISVEKIQVEWISFETAMLEFFMMGLRKSGGISLKDFIDRFSRRLPGSFEAALEQSSRKAWVEKSPTGYRLTPEGLLMNNEVLQLMMN